MREHTPGPWKYDIAFDTVNAVNADGSPRMIVADAYRLKGNPCTASIENWPANARLIASAPELLDALRLADRILQRDGIQQLRGEAFVDDEVDRIRAAIAKAEGRTDD